MPIVPVAETLELVSVSPESFSVPALWDAVVVLSIVVVVQQVGREADRWRDEEQFAAGGRAASVEDLEVQAEGGGGERRWSARLYDGPGDVAAADLRSPAVFDDGAVPREEHQV